MTNAAPPRPRGADHIAFPTWKPLETLRFYRDVLGLPLAHAITAKTWPRDDFQPDFVHFFFELDNGDRLAFFYYFGEPARPAPDPLMHRARHVALHLASRDELLAWRTRLMAHGVRVTHPVEHETLTSIYFDDPNGLQLEMTCQHRPLGDADAVDAAETLEALGHLLREDAAPSLEKLWQRKARRPDPGPSARVRFLDVAEMAPFVNAARAAGAEISRDGRYLTASAVNELRLTRESCGVCDALWFGALTGGFVGTIARFDEREIVVRPP